MAEQRLPESAAFDEIEVLLACERVERLEHALGVGRQPAIGHRHQLRLAQELQPVPPGVRDEVVEVYGIVDFGEVVVEHETGVTAGEALDL
jgi:hypothetical protein